MKPQIILLIVLISFYSTSVLAQYEWELRQDKDEIFIYTRSLPDKKYLEFKASTEVEASLHSLMALIKSVDQMSTWMGNFKENELLDSKGFWHQVSYHEVYVPIIYNRDLVLELEMRQEKAANAIRIDMRCLPDYLPEKKKKARIQEMHGYWLCTPIDNGKIRIEYSMYVDPGSTIPGWLYNMRIKKDPYNTLTRIKKKVREAQFKEAYYAELEAESN